MEFANIAVLNKGDRLGLHEIFITVSQYSQSFAFFFLSYIAPLSEKIINLCNRMVFSREVDQITVSGQRRKSRLVNDTKEST